jgi:hypothetical protein
MEYLFIKFILYKTIFQELLKCLEVSRSERSLLGSKMIVQKVFIGIVQGIGDHHHLSLVEEQISFLISKTSIKLYIEAKS